MHCQAKHSELFADKTLTSERQNQLLLSVASCIFFRKQGNNNDKLKSAEGGECGGGGGGGGGRNYTSAGDFNNYFDAVELLARQEEDRP